MVGGNPVRFLKPGFQIYFQYGDNYFLLCQVNCVVMRGLNEDEICNFVAMTADKVSFDKIEAE